jgi:RNA polymerase sigma factor for flagellar operon FliA
MSPIDDALWTRYRANGDLEARADLLDRYLGLVHHAAHELGQRVGQNIEIEELVSAGTIGLVQALEGFDGSRGLSFSTYAVPRIRGAMLDELRARDWKPRSVRSNARKLEQVESKLRRELGRAPTPAETAEELGLDLAGYWQLREQIEGGAIVPLDAPASDGLHAVPLYETLADEDAEETDRVVDQQDQMGQLRDAIASLPVKERTVLSLYYYEELNLKQIGAILHLTESRVSQIRTQALKRLRELPHLVER